MSNVENYWISWFDPCYGGWELHSPWWVSGYRGSDDAPTICAAVKAESAEEAKASIHRAYDMPCTLEFRFVEEKPPGWSPFSDRFRRAEWMQWT